MKTYAQAYPIRAFIYGWLKDPLQSFIREHPIHLPFGFKKGHYWQIRHFGWITYYWDMGIDHTQGCIILHKPNKHEKPKERKATNFML